MRIMVARMAPLIVKVAIIHHLDLVLILPLDSIRESSNISTSSHAGELTALDTAGLRIVPESDGATKNAQTGRHPVRGDEENNRIFTTAATRPQLVNSTPALSL